VWGCYLPCPTCPTCPFFLCFSKKYKKKGETSKGEKKAGVKDGGEGRGESQKDGQVGQLGQNSSLFPRACAECDETRCVPSPFVAQNYGINSGKKELNARC
jgi:hypothetical protein